MLTLIVGSSHRVISFEFRDLDCNRVRVFDDPLVSEYIAETDIDLDDCNAEELITFIRWLYQQ